MSDDLSRSDDRSNDEAGERLAILTAGRFEGVGAKVAHGVIRYGDREVAAVVDEVFAGKTASEVVPFCGRPVPIVATVSEAVAMGATRLLVGVAPAGGRLDTRLHGTLLEAVRGGLHVEAGLHHLLTDDAELAAEARRTGVELRDLRTVPNDLDVPRGGRWRTSDVDVVHTVGTDCNLGKMTVSLELHRAARARGRGSVFVPTGQTGIAVAGWGIAVDHVVADYVAGAGERLVAQGATRGDLLWLEGQGSLFHPAYSGVTLGLLHGAAPDVLVLVHRVGLAATVNYPDVPLPSLPDMVAAYEYAAGFIKPARVAAIAVDTSAIGETAARRALEKIAEECGRPADDVVRFGSDRILDAVMAQL
ncbi:MAG: DUF1611 domain-containing protein [Micromonosporaceae bacterium]